MVCFVFCCLCGFLVLVGVFLVLVCLSSSLSYCLCRCLSSGYCLCGCLSSVFVCVLVLVFVGVCVCVGDCVIDLVTVGV